MSTLIVKNLGLQDYPPVYARMREFNDNRVNTTPDEIWSLQHPPVFTLGMAGKQQHLLHPGDIPVIQVDRGGQVTYHGPGQLVVYSLLDLRRKSLTIKGFVHLLEQSIIDLLTRYNIHADRHAGAPGVYVSGRKLAALGVRVRKGCCYHGIALNVNMDLEPFQRINPCGYPGLEVTDLHALGIHAEWDTVQGDYQACLLETLAYDRVESHLSENEF